MLFILLLGLQQPDQTPVFRAGTTWVRVDAQAGENKRLLSSLAKDDFVVYDGGRPQPILYFGYESEPLDVLLLLDVSGSMRLYLEQMAAHAREALGALREGDRVGVMTFSRHARIEEHLTTDRRKVIGEIKDAVQATGLGSGTRINAAILSAAAYMSQHAGEKGRRAVLILTDNQSLSYQEPNEIAIEALLGADTVLNAIVVGRGERARPPKPGVYQNPDFTPADVFKIAEETGGEAVKAARVDAWFRALMESIRTRYSLEYRAPADAAAGSFRPIRVELSPEARHRHPHAWVHARGGYVVK